MQILAATCTYKHSCTCHMFHRSQSVVTLRCMLVSCLPMSPHSCHAMLPMLDERETKTRGGGTPPHGHVSRSVNDSSAHMSTWSAHMASHRIASHRIASHRIGIVSPRLPCRVFSPWYDALVVFPCDALPPIGSILWRYTGDAVCDDGDGDETDIRSERARR